MARHWLVKRYFPFPCLWHSKMVESDKTNCSETFSYLLMERELSHLLKVWMPVILAMIYAKLFGMFFVFCTDLSIGLLHILYILYTMEAGINPSVPVLTCFPFLYGCQEPQIEVEEGVLKESCSSSIMLLLPTHQQDSPFSLCLSICKLGAWQCLHILYYTVAEGLLNLSSLYRLTSGLPDQRSKSVIFMTIVNWDRSIINRFMKKLLF